MSEWKEYRLGDISNMTYGKLPKSITETGRYPVNTGYRNVGYSNTFNCKKDSIIVVARGVGGCGDVKIAVEDCFLTNLSISVDLKRNVCLPSYFYYSRLKDNLNYLNTGSAQPQITIDSLQKFIISLPDLPTQRRIAAILSSLDAKIENNNKVNAKLEEIAQNLFKEWFVDFGPFKDGKFVDSELGPIPEGWRVGTLSDIGSIVGGSTPSKSHPEYYTSEGIAWLTPKDLSNTGVKFTSKGEIDITEAGYNSTSTKLMPKGSVLFSSRAPIGYLTIAKNEICTNQGFKSVVPTFAGTGFIYYLLKQLTPEIENRAVGTTFKEASGSLMSSLNVIIPDKKVLDRFEILIKSLFDKQELLETESFKLSTLRDTLLPKLMSGEIEV